MRGRSRLVVAIAGVLVLLLLVYFFLIRPRKSELAAVKVQVEAEEQKTAQLRLELARLEALRDNAPKLQADLAKILQFVPRNHETPNFIFTIEDTANEAGVEIISLTNEQAKVPKEGASVAETAVQLSIEGGYFAVQDFMRRLYDLDRALRLDVVTLAGSVTEAGDVEIAVQMSARIFFQLPEASAPAPVAGATPAPTATPVPGSTPITSPTPAP